MAEDSAPIRPRAKSAALETGSSENRSRVGKWSLPMMVTHAASAMMKATAAEAARNPMRRAGAMGAVAPPRATGSPRPY